MTHWPDLFFLPYNERQNHRFHLVGIGGTGLAPIAKVLLQMGFRVSGSDRVDNERTTSLRSWGARVRIGHAAEHLTDDRHPPQHPDVVLISSAVPSENPEIQQARAWHIPVVKRKDILGPLTSGRQVIAVAGTHGKTTTTALITHLLVRCGRKPGYIIGSEIPELGFSDAGEEPVFVIEADEYDHMFLGLQPWRLVITNLDWDHPDMFPTHDSYVEAFRQLMTRVRSDGQIIYCRDDPTLRRWEKEGLLAHALSYGSFLGAAIRAENIDMGPEGASYQLIARGRGHPVRLAIQGMHNVLNSMAALLAVEAAGIPLETAIPHLRSYQGAARRFEFKGEVAGVMIIDDYAHHPTEVRSTLQAARAAYPERDIWAIYQPHTFSRTRTFLDQFNGIFNAADHLIVTDIYPAREPIDPNITPELVAAASHHEQAMALREFDAIIAHLTQKLRPNSLVIILSAGTATQLGPMLLENLRRQRTGRPI